MLWPARFLQRLSIVSMFFPVSPVAIVPRSCAAAAVLDIYSAVRLSGASASAPASPSHGERDGNTEPARSTAAPVDPPLPATRAVAAAVSTSTGAPAPPSRKTPGTPNAPRETLLTRALVIKLSEDLKGRSGMSLDPIEARLVLGTWSAPKPGGPIARLPAWASSPAPASPECA